MSAMASLLRKHPYGVALGATWVLPFVLMLVLHATLPDSNADGQCTGIGFGCVPAPRDAVVFIWLLASPVWFLGGALACGLIALRRRMRRPGPTYAADTTTRNNPG